VAGARTSGARAGKRLHRRAENGPQQVAERLSLRHDTFRQAHAESAFHPEHELNPGQAVDAEISLETRLEHDLQAWGRLRPRLDEQVMGQRNEAIGCISWVRVGCHVAQADRIGPWIYPDSRRYSILLRSGLMKNPLLCSPRRLPKETG